MVAVNHYRFFTTWRVPGPVDRVFDTILDVPRYVEWWPEVYLRIEPASGGYRFLTRGWLPYKLRWESRHVESARPHRIVLEARGDLNGRGVWTLRPNGDAVEAQFEWVVMADKPLVRYLSFLFKPVFRANHRWAMARGEEGLRRELARR